MNIRFIDISSKFELTAINNGDTLYGNYLSYPVNTLSCILHQKYNINTVYDNSYDILVVRDIDKNFFNLLKNVIKPNIKTILVLTESVIYTPLGHSMDIQNNPLWSKVVSYNRELYTPKTIYYDIPITGIQLPVNISYEKKFKKGCFIATYKKNDLKGYTGIRDSLIKKLAEDNTIDVYGKNWPLKNNYFGKSPDKINTISKYSYTIAIENSKYSGYVTEKIGDSILAEVPCLYFGDTINARRRFSDTFVELQDLSPDSFYKALSILNNNYDYYKKNVIAQKKESVHWCDSYIEAMIKAITE